MLYCAGGGPAHLPAALVRNRNLARRRPRNQAIQTAPRVVAGAFQFRIDGPQRALRLIDWGVNLRSRYLQMPYGDQALLLKTDTFHTIGGFSDLPIMDDFELVRRLRRLGRIAILPLPAITSARRWQTLGAWQRMWINQKVIAGYYLGVPPDRLAKWYRADRRPLPTNCQTRQTSRTV